MADDIFIVNTLVGPGDPPLTIADDGTGTDTIVVRGAPPGETRIFLDTTTDGGPSATARFGDGTAFARLIVTGVIENATGGNGHDLIRGNARANVLYGDQAEDRGQADTIDAGGGRDKVHGCGGDDTLSGENGNDLLYGGTGKDLVYGGAGNDRIYGGDGADRLKGDAGNDTIRGEGGIDRLFGGGGDDVLYGGTGDDIITGGAGRDVMTGGAGVDTFVFNDISETGKTPETADRILDFAVFGATDQVDLRPIDANIREDSPGNDHFDVIFDDPFSHTAGELRAHFTGEDYILEGDVDGDAMADFMIVLEHASGFSVYF